MTDTPSASGADLARQALAAARAAAKNRPDPGQKKTRRSMRPSRGEHGDPQGLGNILGKLTAEQGWDTSIGAGDLIDRWPTLVPSTYATTTQPAGYDTDTGTLTIRAASHTIATGLRMAEPLLIKTVNSTLGRAVVRRIRVQVGGPGPAFPELEGSAAARPSEPEASVKTREDASPGFRTVLALALEHKPERAPANPYVEEAARRQEAALRAGRQSASEDREAYWATQPTGPEPGSMAASEAAALAFKRQDAAGRAPRRAFDVA